MFVLIVGCGRVGSAIANSMLEEGHEVSVLDEDAEAIALLDRGQANSWEERGGQFTEGTALEIDALLAAGIERADAFVASTDGDNTNLVIAQIAQAPLRRRPRGGAGARPGAGALVRRAGPPDRLPHADGDRAARGGRARADPLRGSGRLAMYVVIVGAGKVGWNLARELINKRHEVTVVESDAASLRGGRAGARAQRDVRRRLRAVGARALGDRARRPRGGGDRRRRGQHPHLAGRAREVRRGARRGALQQPAQPPALRAARRAARDLGHRPDPAADRARGAEVRPRAPARPARGAARDHRARGGRRGRPPPAAP